MKKEIEMATLIDTVFRTDGWFAPLLGGSREMRDFHETAQAIDRLSDAELRDLGLHRGSVV